MCFKAFNGVWFPVLNRSLSFKILRATILRATIVKGFELFVGKIYILLYGSSRPCYIHNQEGQSILSCSILQMLLTTAGMSIVCQRVNHFANKLNVYKE